MVHLKCRTDGEMQDNSSQVKGSDESPVAQQPADYNFNCLNQVILDIIHNLHKSVKFSRII